MGATVTRHFVTVGTRQVHYRRAGSGPPVLLLHQSPKTSADMLPMLEVMAPHCTVIAPDNPGYGLSDALPVLPTLADMDDFADALAGFLDALGLPQVAVYGFHTGAAIGTRLAARHAARVTALAANGVLLTTEEERRDFRARYLPAFAPAWDGSHLAWLWARMREQTIFFPWYRRTAAARMTYAVPSPERLQANVMDFLLAGDAYRAAYGAALGYDKKPDIAGIAVPTLFLCARADPLAVYLDPVGRIAPPVAATFLSETADGCLAAARDFLLRHLPGRPAPPPPAHGLPEGRVGGDHVRTAGGQLRLRGTASATGRPVLLIHDLGRSSAQLDAIVRSFAGLRTAVAIDLPGHGDSDDVLAGAAPSVGAFADAVGQAADALGLAEAGLVGLGRGAAIALDLAARRPDLVDSVHVVGAAGLTADEVARHVAHAAPDLTPDAWGGHLLKAWHHARTAALFWPWFDTGLTGIARVEPQLDETSLHRAVIDLFKCDGLHGASVRAQAGYPLLDALRACAKPVVAWTAPFDPASARAAETAAAAGRPLRELPSDTGAWGHLFAGAAD